MGNRVDRSAGFEREEEEIRLSTADTAPEDDEPYTPEDRAAVAEALRDLEEERTVSHEEVKRSWGLR